MKTAYPSTRNPVTITLYANIPFDNTYKNHTIISSLFKYNNQYIYAGSTNACERFINRFDTNAQRVYPQWTLATDTYNFNYSNGLLCSVVLELTAEQTNANFMKVVCGSDIYYYFITAINQVNLDTYTLSLELDVLMTYQDEFLNGMKDVPVFTTRKHCHRYTSNGQMPYCADLRGNDDVFAGVKPNIIENVIKLQHKDVNLRNIADVKWLYVCVDPVYADTQDITNPLYTCLGKNLPLTMLALPINVDKLTYKKYNDNVTPCECSFTKENIISGVTKLINDGVIHGAKISSYPPFTNATSGSVTLTSGNFLTITGDVVGIVVDENTTIYEMTIGDSKLLYGKIPGIQLTGLFELIFKYGFVIIANQDDCIYPTQNITFKSLGIGNLNAPTILSNRYDDPKLLFSPFKKYVLNAQYSSEGMELYPEITFSEAPSFYTEYLTFETTTTAYIGDNNYFTRVKTNSSNVYDYYNYEKIGLSSCVNYIIPCGTNALDVFNSTQAQSFYQSKMASGITSGLTTLGGAGMTALGIAGLAGAPFTNGMSAVAGIGLLSAGLTSMAGGVAGIAETIKSSEAKITDLKNTPDSINISGSNYFTDEWTTQDTNSLPYIVIYNSSTALKEKANDYYYHFGYQVARDTNFNTELKIDNSVNHFVDNNLFGRTIFNYIQINEDITNKINANIPLIVKQKLSSIFNDGITVWNFFGFSGLWTLINVPLANYEPEKWFMKNTLDNTEYKV